MKKGLSKLYVNIIEDMYEDTRTRIRGMCGKAEDFTIRVEMHQGSALSTHLFSLVMDKI